MLSLLFVLATAAFARPPDATWLNQPAALTTADALNMYSGLINGALKSQIDPSSGVLDMNIWLVDAEGHIRVEMLLTSDLVSNIQGAPPGKQTALLLGMHQELAQGLLETIRTSDPSSSSGIGIFGNTTLPNSPFQDVVGKYLASRDAADIVLSLGFRQGTASHLYTTVFHDRVVFAPDAPTAR